MFAFAVASSKGNTIELKFKFICQLFVTLNLNLK